MNTDTGKVYSTPETIAAAQARGENLKPISERAAKLIAEARIEKARRLTEHRRNKARSTKQSRRRRDAMQKASRRGNR